MARPVLCHALLHPKCRNQQLFPLFRMVPTPDIGTRTLLRSALTAVMQRGALATGSRFVFAHTADPVRAPIMNNRQTSSR
jgi:hypothetical protein